MKIRGYKSTEMGRMKQTTANGGTYTATATLHQLHSAYTVSPQCNFSIA